jgi:hypothetical protein
MSPEEQQQIVDDLLQTSPAERKRLSRREVPWRLEALSSTISGGSDGPGLLLLALGLFLATIGLGSVVPAGYGHVVLILGLVATAAPILTMNRRQVRTRNHARQVWSERGRVRVVEGEVRTRRSWSFTYGEVYRLIAEVHLGAEVHQVPELGEHLLSGPVRVFLLIIPSLEPPLAPACEKVVAIELHTGALVGLRPPTIAPPDEPYRARAPADE